MKLFEILQLKKPDLAPEQCKLHLAVWNGQQDPLNVFLEGRFEEWQRWQGKQHFRRPYIVALIRLPEAHKWIFAGTHRSLGCQWVNSPKPPHYAYQTKMVPETEELTGRLVVRYEKTCRQSYLNAEKWANDLAVEEMRPEPMTIGEFPGYNHVLITKQQLDTLVRRQNPSWRAALKNVPGIYLIADTKTGRLYVGSATSEDGIWQRWQDYSRTGHGGNKLLRKLLNEKNADYANHFQFSILETGNMYSTRDEILARETHWKQILCSRDRQGGYNAN